MLLVCSSPGSGCACTGRRSFTRTIRYLSSSHCAAKAPVALEHVPDEHQSPKRFGLFPCWRLAVSSYHFRLSWPVLLTTFLYSCPSPGCGEHNFGCVIPPITFHHTFPLHSPTSAGQYKLFRSALKSTSQNWSLTFDSCYRSSFTYKPGVPGWCIS